MLKYVPKVGDIVNVKASENSNFTPSVDLNKAIVTHVMLEEEGANVEYYGTDYYVDWSQLKKV